MFRGTLPKILCLGRIGDLVEKATNLYMFVWKSCSFRNMIRRLQDGSYLIKSLWFLLVCRSNNAIRALLRL